MRGEGSQPKRIDPTGKEGEEGVKKDRGEKRETTAMNAFHIKTLNSFFPSPHLAGKRILTLSLSSFYISPPLAYMPACACTRVRGVKGKNELSSTSSDSEEVL